MAGRKGRPAGGPAYSRGFDLAFTIVTAWAVIGVGWVLVRMFLGADPVATALLRVVVIGVGWVLLGVVLAALLPVRQPRARVPRPITTRDVDHDVPRSTSTPRTVQGRFFLPERALREGQLAPSAVVMASIADAIDGVVAAAERDGRELAWETIQVCLLPLPKDRAGWQVLAEVEVVHR